MCHLPSTLGLGVAAIVFACSYGWESDSCSRSSDIRLASRGGPRRVHLLCGNQMPSRAIMVFFVSLATSIISQSRNGPSTITAFLCGRLSPQSFGKGPSGASRCFPQSSWSCTFRVTFKSTRWPSREAQSFCGLLPGLVRFLQCPYDEDCRFSRLLALLFFQALFWPAALFLSVVFGSLTYAIMEKMPSGS